MKITVLMSTYNGERYIREQIDSILCQDIRKKDELKLLVRDDGSSDSTISILSEYREKYGDIVEYYSGENLRTEKSFWNLVMKAPESDYYAFSDQDDVWFGDKLSRAVRILEKMKKKYTEHSGYEIPLLYCSAVSSVDSNMKEIKMVRDELNKFTDFPHSLIYSTAQGCTFVFNHKARTELMKYDMDVLFPEYHDWLTHRIVAMKGKMYFDKRSTMYYRQHGNNVIGFQEGGIKGFIRRVKKFAGRSTESVRSRCAENLLKVYGDELDENQKEILKEVAYYRKSKVYRDKFLKDKRFMPGGINTLFLKFLILTKRV